MTTKKTTIRVKGTHCTACKKLIEDVLTEVPGVIASTVDFETGETSIEHNDTISWDEVKRAIEDLGDYTVHLS